MSVPVAKKYIYHFEAKNLGETEGGLTCDYMAYLLGKKNSVDLSRKVAAQTSASSLFVPSEQTLAEEWKEIATLQWKYVSDGKVDIYELQRRLNAAARARIALAMHRILEHVCPALDFKNVPQGTLLQIIALGNETLITAGSDAEFYRFIEKETQSIDIMSVLQS